MSLKQGSNVGRFAFWKKKAINIQDGLSGTRMELEKIMLGRMF